MQTVAKVPVDVQSLGVDLLSLSAHKFNGPKGAGALYIKRGTRIMAILTGGKHERTRRAGTENVAAIAGMGEAAKLAAAKLQQEGHRLAHCAIGWRRESSAVFRAPPSTDRWRPGFRTRRTSASKVWRRSRCLIALDLEGIAVSTGSACSSGTLEPSHVLRAMGFPAHRTQNSIRVSLGQGNTEEQVDYFLDKLPAVVQKLRSAYGSQTVT